MIGLLVNTKLDKLRSDLMNQRPDVPYEPSRHIIHTLMILWSNLHCLIRSSFPAVKAPLHHSEGYLENMPAHLECSYFISSNVVDILINSAVW